MRLMTNLIHTGRHIHTLGYTAGRRIHTLRYTVGRRTPYTHREAYTPIHTGRHTPLGTPLRELHP